MTAPARERALRTPDADAQTRLVVQRKCGCGGSCGPCADEKKKKVQRRAIGDAAHDLPQSVSSILGSAGRALDEETRGSMESRFGRSFADVRVHTDTHAADSAKEINAAAYTSGTHIVFGAGRFAPQTPDGRRLLAHELAHVVQQHSGTALPSGVGPADDVHERAADRIADAVVAQGPAFAPPPAIAPVAERLVRRKREDDAPVSAQEETQRFIVEDFATPSAGQMRRSEFVEELDAAVCETSGREMAALGQSTAGCPLLEQWRPKIRAMSTRQLEVSIRRWIETDATIRTARDYIPLVAERLSSSIRTWGKTGQILGVPADLLDLLAGGKIKVSVGSVIKGAIGSLFRKARDGAAMPASGVAFDGCDGRPLDAGVASRMGRAFGRDFSDVRIHTGADAESAATHVNARAFTVGHDIAFAHGEYAPGTLVGDALLAHELAHVAQQDGAEGVLTKSEDAGSALEHDADDAAVHAVVALRPRLARFLGDVRTNAMPRLKSSLKLQRCSASPNELQSYLGKLDKTNKIEGGSGSDDNARDVVEAWSTGDTQYVLTARRKRLLIEEMLDGYVSIDDQKQILKLVEGSFGWELQQMLGPNGVPHARLLDDFGWHKKELWRFYMRRYPDAYGETAALDLELRKELEPQAPPDRKALDAAKPSEQDYSVLQPGTTKFPETTVAKNVEPSRDKKARVTKQQAAQWIKEQYGSYVSEDAAKLADAAKVQTHSDKQFEAVIQDCMTRERAKGSTQSDNDLYHHCEIKHERTAGFYDRPTNTIHVHSGREAPSTMLHETMHAFSSEKVHQLAWYGSEGLTEYFTRQVILRHKYVNEEKPLYVGGFYTQAIDAINELVLIAGEDLLAKVYFGGDIKSLCTLLGKARFDAWVAAMDKEDVLLATNVLRGVAPVQPAKGNC